MTTARQIYQLQELDQEIAQLRSSLTSVEEQLGDRSSLDSLEGETNASQAQVQELLRQQHGYELDSEAVRQRVQETQQKLYGGTVTNLRELEALEKELAGLKARSRKMLIS